MDREFTKAQRKRLRELCALAHERELSGELARLEAAFRRWRASELDAFELSDRIHRFHDGPARELFLRYEGSDVALVVASAMQRGVLSEADAGADVADLLRSRVELFQDLERRDAQRAAASGRAPRPGSGPDEPASAPSRPRRRGPSAPEEA
jgi:hypothetical protein